MVSLERYNGNCVLVIRKKVLKESYLNSEILFKPDCTPKAEAKLYIRTLKRT